MRPHRQLQPLAVVGTCPSSSSCSQAPEGMLVELGCRAPWVGMALSALAQLCEDFHGPLWTGLALQADALGRAWGQVSGRPEPLPPHGPDLLRHCSGCA